MHETDMALHIDRIANAVIPETRVPKRFGLFLGNVTAIDHATGEACLQVFHAPAKIIVLFRKHPDHMQMVGQNDHGDGLDRVEVLKIASAVGQLADMPGQQGAIGVGEGDGQKPGPLGPEEGVKIAHSSIKQGLYNLCKLQNCNGFFLVTPRWFDRFARPRGR